MLVLAPLGVFGLAVPLAAKLGLGAAGALADYIGVVVLLSTLLMALTYPVVALLEGGTSLGAYARAALPLHAMAFSGRSSLAALPATITATRDVLRLPPQIPGFLVPLLNATYRLGAGVGQTVPILFIAQLYGVTLPPAQLAVVAGHGLHCLLLHPRHPRWHHRGNDPRAHGRGASGRGGRAAAGRGHHPRHVPHHRQCHWRHHGRGDSGGAGATGRVGGEALAAGRVAYQPM